MLKTESNSLMMTIANHLNSQENNHKLKIFLSQIDIDIEYFSKIIELF